jgi:hypothetical protein
MALFTTRDRGGLLIRKALADMTIREVGGAVAEAIARAIDAECRLRNRHPILFGQIAAGEEISPTCAEFEDFDDWDAQVPALARAVRRDPRDCRRRRRRPTIAASGARAMAAAASLAPLPGNCPIEQRLRWPETALLQLGLVPPGAPRGAVPQFHGRYRIVSIIG